MRTGVTLYSKVRVTFLFRLFICPIAYSMGQIIKSVCVCQSVSVSVCEHSHGRIS